MGYAERPTYEHKNTEIMRKNTAILMTLFMFASSMMIATETQGEGKDKVKERIINKLYDSEQQEQGMVNAKFLVNEQGEVMIESVESENQSLKLFVTGRLEGLVIQFKDKVKEGDSTYNLNILFRKEK